MQKTFHLIFSPRRTSLCKDALETHNVYGELNIKDFNFDLIPLESDLLSLEIDYIFKDYYLGNDLSII
jgi:hypothetical protein